MIETILILFARFTGAYQTLTRILLTVDEQQGNKLIVRVQIDI
jgi:hypothetical protein